MTVSEPQSPPLVIHLFGPMQVIVEGQPLPHLRSRKALWLLALLVLREGKPVERDWLAGTLWPDIDESKAAANLRVNLSELRRALGSQGTRLQSPGRYTLTLDLAGATADVRQFDEAMAERDIPALQQAVALYRGPLLEGCTEEWTAQERLARERGCLLALLTLAETALAAAEYEAAAGYFRRGIDLEPLSEAAQRGLMQALSQSGDANAALDAYQLFVRLLRRDDPKASPDAQTNALYTRLRSEARKRAASPLVPAGAETPAPVVAGYLPHPLTDLVGREDERVEVASALRRKRLVTLTGPGGIGKTRLAIQIATEAAAEFPDGAWMVALEALSGDAALVGQIASVLGVKEETGRSIRESLTDSLRSRRLLLILDNCEHLLEAAARISSHLLLECAGLRILATSREALGIPGETAWSVPALAVPDPEHLPAGQSTLVRVLSGYESVQLFVERAQSVQKTFTLNAENALLIAKICARLEGIPLAIELAAARVRSLAIEQIETRLDNYLGLLTGSRRAMLPRHQTLRAALDWSYDLLDTAERNVLERLSVFAGGCDLAAAEHVCSGGGVESGDVLNLLTSLADKSLVIFSERSGGRGSRYRLLEMVRQYAAERLEARSGDDSAECLRARHRAWMRGVVDADCSGDYGSLQAQLVQHLTVEHDNLRATLSWEGATANDPEADLVFLGRVRWLWESRGLYAEGRGYFERALSRKAASAPTRARANALNEAASLCNAQADYATAQSLLEECLSIYRLIGRKQELFSTIHQMSNIAQGQGDYQRAMTLIEECLCLAREMDRQRDVATALLSAGNIHGHLGNYAASRAAYQESLGVFRKLGDRNGIGTVLGSLGHITLLQRDWTTAQTLFEESLRVFREIGVKHAIAMALANLSGVNLKRGNYGEAEILLEEAHCLVTETGNRQGIRIVLTYMGRAAYLQADYQKAWALHTDALRISRDIGARQGVASSLRELSFVSVALGNPGKCIRLRAADEALCQSLGAPLASDDPDEDERTLQRARERLGPDACEAAWSAGAALGWEQAADLALEEA